MRRTVVLGLMFLGLVASAHAAQFHLLRTYGAWHPNDDPYPHMLAAAESYWHTAPACGNPTDVMSTVTPAGVQQDSWAWVLPGDACRIYLQRSMWSSVLIAGRYSTYCRIYVHEYAHLLGLWDQPSGILAHDVTPSIPLPQCDTVTLHEDGGLYQWRHGTLRLTRF